MGVELLREMDKDRQLAHAYDSKHVYQCIRRLGLVGYGSHCHLPTVRLSHAELVKLVRLETLPVDEVGRLAALNGPDLALYAFAVRRADALEDAIPLDFEPRRCSSR